MKYKVLGKSTLQVSEISFGCMSLGTDHAENKSLLSTAIDRGINYFDTADIYQNGFNEVTVGNALKSVREKVLIASKVGNQPRNDGSGWDWNPTKKIYPLLHRRKSETTANRLPGSLPTAWRYDRRSNR